MMGFVLWQQKNLKEGKEEGFFFFFFFFFFG